MSRSFHQRHGDSHRGKSPRVILDKFIDNNGKTKYKFRNIKMKPYGRVFKTGYGGESYLKKYGEICYPVINVKKERREAKQNILNIIDETNINE